MNELISFTQISTYVECPYKYYLAYVLNEKPLYKETYELGKTIHNIIKTYYEIMPSSMTPKEVRMFITVSAKKNGLDLEKNISLLENFARFEEQRITWNINPKPIAVEKEFVKKPFHGIVDALFIDKNGDKIVVDWKTSLKREYDNWEMYRLQGNIYMYITDSKKVIFYGLRRGDTIEFTYDEKYLLNMLDSFKKSIERKFFERKRGEHCLTCEYNLLCKTYEYGFEVFDL